MERGDICWAIKDIWRDAVALSKSPLRYIYGGAKGLWLIVTIVVALVCVGVDPIKAVLDWIVDPTHRHILLTVTVIIAVVAALLTHVYDRVIHRNLKRVHDQELQGLRNQISSMTQHADAAVAPIRHVLGDIGELIILHEIYQRFNANMQRYETTFAEQVKEVSNGQWQSVPDIFGASGASRLHAKSIRTDLEPAFAAAGVDVITLENMQQGWTIEADFQAPGEANAPDPASRERYRQWFYFWDRMIFPQHEEVCKKLTDRMVGQLGALKANAGLSAPQGS